LYKCIILVLKNLFGGAYQACKDAWPCLGMHLFSTCHQYRTHIEFSHTTAQMCLLQLSLLSITVWLDLVFHYCTIYSCLNQPDNAIHSSFYSKKWQPHQMMPKIGIWLQKQSPRPFNSAKYSPLFILNKENDKWCMN
jgi:hypothetical protein